MANPLPSGLSKGRRVANSFRLGEYILVIKRVTAGFNEPERKTMNNKTRAASPASLQSFVTRPPRDVVFEELPVPVRMSLWHTNNGGKNLRRFVAKRGNEFIRVMSAQEPVGVGGSFVGHVSVTIANDDIHETPPSRFATEKEQGWVLHFLGLDADQVECEHSPECCHFWYV